MSLSDEQFHAIQTAFRRLPDTAPLSPAEVATAFEHHRAAVVAAARVSEPDPTLIPIYRAVRLLTMLGQFRIPAEYAQAHRIIQVHGHEAVRQKLQEGRDHPAARQVLKSWVAQAVDHDDSLARDPDEAQAQAPIHDTPLPPPGAAAPPLRGSQPQPARSMAPISNGASSAAPIGRAPPAPSDRQRGNVLAMPPRNESPQGFDPHGDHDHDGHRAEPPTNDPPPQRTFNDDKVECFTKGKRGAALRFSNAVDDRRSTVRHIVFAELAPIAGNGQNYLWKEKKITIMLNDAEVEQVIMVLLGYLQMARFSAHGTDKKKWFQIQNQPHGGQLQGRVQVQAGDGQNSHILNIFPQDITRVVAVLLRGYKAMRNVSEEFACMMLRAAARNYALAAEVSANAAGGGQARDGDAGRQYRAASG